MTGSRWRPITTETRRERETGPSANKLANHSANPSWNDDFASLLVFLGSREYYVIRCAVIDKTNKSPVSPHGRSCRERIKSLICIMCFIPRVEASSMACKDWIPFLFYFYFNLFIFFSDTIARPWQSRSDEIAESHSRGERESELYILGFDAGTFVAADNNRPAADYFHDAESVYGEDDHRTSHLETGDNRHAEDFHAQAYRGIDDDDDDSQTCPDHCEHHAKTSDNNSENRHDPSSSAKDDAATRASRLRSQSSAVSVQRKLLRDNDHSEACADH